MTAAGKRHRHVVISIQAKLEAPVAVALFSGLPAYQEQR